MPQPTATDVLYDPQLTTLSVAYMQNATNFVAGQVFPTVPSELQGGKYVVWDRAAWLRVAAQRRAPGTESAGSGFTLSRQSFLCEPYAFHKDIDDQDKANQSQPINLELTATKWVTQQLMLKREALFASSFMVNGVWATDVAGVASGPVGAQVIKWSASGSTPVDDIALYKDQVGSVSGLDPNVLVLNRDTYRVLRNNAEIQDRIKFGGSPAAPSQISTQALAELFELDKVLVTRAVQTTSPEGAAATYGDVAGSGGALLAYASPEPGPDTPSAGYSFAWTGYLGAGAEGNRIKNFRMENIQSDRIEGELAIDLEVVASDLAVHFAGLV